MSRPFASGDARGGTNFGNNNGSMTPTDADNNAGEAWVQPVGYDYGQYVEPEGRPPAANPENGSSDNWGHNMAKYEWHEDFGDVGPKNDELEKLLFSAEYKIRKGIKYDALADIKVTVETKEEDRTGHILDFDEAGLHPVMIENIKLCGYEKPTPIQAYTIPAVVHNRDVIAVSQTGSGKTAAFLIPTISKLMGKIQKLAARRPALNNGFNPMVEAVRAEPLILIVAPTRELCTQIFDEARRLCYRSMMRPCVAYGGAPKRGQTIELQRGCDILVATPGRLLDFMSMPHVLSLGRLRYTILDEADELISPDWEEDMSKIMAGGDTNEDGNHHYLLFSATFKPALRKVAKTYLSNDHIRIRIGRAGSTNVNIRQNLVWVERDRKRQALYDLLVSMPPSRTLIFVASKKVADFVDDHLFNMGMPSTSIHSSRTQREREDAIRAFRKGSAPILVATAVTARGLDIQNVMHVINYDLPSTEHGGIDEYVHRIGRTARIGHEGLATSFYNDYDESLGSDLVKVLMETNQEIPDFLEDKKPAEGETLEFSDDSEAEDHAEDAGNADNKNGADAGGWGAEPAEQTAAADFGGAAANAPAESAAPADAW